MVPAGIKRSTSYKAAINRTDDGASAGQKAGGKGLASAEMNESKHSSTKPLLESDGSGFILTRRQLRRRGSVTAATRCLLPCFSDSAQLIRSNERHDDMAAAA